MDWRKSLREAVLVHGPKAIVYAANADSVDFNSHDLKFMKDINRTQLDRVIEASYKVSEAAFLEFASRSARVKK